MKARSMLLLTMLVLAALAACTAPPTLVPTAVPPTAVPSTKAAEATKPAAPQTTAPTGAATKPPAPTATLRPPAVTAPAGAVKVQFWHYFSAPEQVEMIQKFADEFNAKNPQYYVVPTLQGTVSDMARKVNASITAGAVPDMATGNPGDLFDYNTAGALIPLDQYIKDAKDGLTADQLAEMTMKVPNGELFFDQIGGQTFGISPGRSMQVMYYNITMLKAAGFDKPPATWDEFDKICAAVTKGDIYCYPGTASSIDTSFFASSVFSRGGTYASADEKKATFDEPAGVETLQWLKNQATKGWGKVPSVTSRGDQADFGNGKAAFAFSTTAGLPFFQDIVSGRKEGPFEWSIAPFPAGPKGKQLVDFFGPSIGIFKTNADRQRGAWLFLKYLLGKDQQAEFGLRLSYFPATKSGREAILGMDADKVKAINPRIATVLPQFKQAISYIPLGVREPTSPAWQGVRATIMNMTTAVFTGKGTADFTATEPQAAAKEGVERVNKLLSQYGK